jgi:hypothetical protein
MLYEELSRILGENGVLVYRRQIETSDNLSVSFCPASIQKTAE